MNEPERLPPGIHAETTLLPWLINGTLEGRERQDLERHLSACTSCRAELNELQSLRKALLNIYQAQPGPSPQTARFVLSTVARETSARTESQSDHGGWLERFDQWVRSLFLPRWVPTFAALLLVVQVGVFTWATLTKISSDEVTTRSLGPQTTRFVVLFQNSVTQEQIRNALHEVRGRIVDGPSQDGAYTIQVLASDSTVARQKLETLRRLVDVIRSADMVAR
jgi:hypothetical protein